MLRSAGPRCRSRRRRSVEPKTLRSSRTGLRVAPREFRYHTASMPNVLVRDLPKATHATLQQRAERQGQSLQQYLASELTRLAERPTPEELFARVSRRRGGKVGLTQAVTDLASERPAS